MTMPYEFGPPPPFELVSTQHYTDKDFEKIRKSFKARTDLDRADFKYQLEVAASWYLLFAAADPAKKGPSERERIWRRFGSQIAGVLSKLEERQPGELRTLAHLGLYQAAHRLTRRTRALPDFEVDQVSVTPVGDAILALAKGDCHDEGLHMSVAPVEAQIEKCIDSLRWLQDCIAEAEAIAIEEKSPKGGNRADPARRYLYESMVAIYRGSARSPKPPWWDEINEKYKGEAIEFLEAALRPLGVTDSRNVICKQSRGHFPKTPKKPGQNVVKV